MLKWLARQRKHILLWAALVAYSFSANALYVNLVLRDGKPAGRNLALPAVSPSVVYKFSDVLQPVRVHGADLFELRGYAFDKSAPAANNKISVVLVSEKGNLVYPTRGVQYPNMIESYPGYKDAMASAEFSLLLSPNTLPPGTYRLGVLLDGGAQAYALTNCMLQVTANTIKYIPGAS